MISSYLAMQNAILARNTALYGMVNASDAMLSAACQPIKPSFQGADNFELQNKLNETKYTVADKLADYFEKLHAYKLKHSAPKFAGLNYKA